MADPTEKTIVILRSILKVIQAAFSEYLKTNPKVKVAAKVVEVIASEYNKFTPDRKKVLKEASPEKIQELIVEIDKESRIFEKVCRIENFSFELNNISKTLQGLESIAMAFNSIHGKLNGLSKDHMEIKDGIQEIKEILKNPNPSKKIKSQKKPIDLNPPRQYLDWIKREYAHMDVEKLGGKQTVAPSMPKIYIPLLAQDPREKKRGKAKNLDLEESRPKDIEQLIAESKRLLIEGQVGSGKSTLLKHLAYVLADEDLKPTKFKTLSGYLPFIVLLKHLNDYFSFCSDEERSVIRSDKILEWYLEKKLEKILEPEVLYGFVLSGKALILLDGLDELQPECRKPIIKTFFNLQTRFPRVKIVVSSRAHGIDANIKKYFINQYTEINDFNPEQIEQFIEKWFAYFYQAEAGPGQRTARAMIGEVKAHPTVDRFTGNPLMLTAVCILYYDQKELPAQRSELYDKLIRNILYRRFGTDDIKVLNFLKRLVFTVHQTHNRAFDQMTAIEVLRRVDPFGDANKGDPRETFKVIDDKCGLLKLNSGMYEFWHLSFQEILTALYFMDETIDPLNEMNPYWEDPWYREVIQLYIGLLSNGSRKTANTIVRNKLSKTDDPRQIIIASDALYDIHRDLRDPQVVNLAKEKLISVFTVGDDPTIWVKAGEILGWLGDKRDLKEFVSIEGGRYDLWINEDEKGTRFFEIESFEIGRYPVVNSWYEEFIRDGGYRNNEWWSIKGINFRKETNQPEYWSIRKLKCPNMPVVGISFFEAEAFCNWLTMNSNEYKYNIPSNDQWKAAAAGKENRSYPWGDGIDKSYCNHYTTGIGRPTPVGIFLRGKTPKGIFDLAGNVWEWTSSYLMGAKRIICGGSWNFVGGNCHSTCQDTRLPGIRFGALGFRLARRKK